MKTCFVFGALEFERMPIKPCVDDLIIAADNGARILSDKGITPDIIIGDFDSLGYVPEGKNNIILPVRKDDTDIGYALKYALEKGYDRFYVYGAVGGLLDHTVANLQLCAYLSAKGAFVQFFGEDITICSVTNGKLLFPKAQNGRFSVFAVDNATGVTINGLSFETENASLDPFFPIGVSNAFDGKESTVEVRNGTLLVMWEGDVIPVLCKK